MAGKYYDNEDVIGSSTKYHRSKCPIVRNIEPKNYKKLQSWKKAVELGLEPCGVCRPFRGVLGASRLDQKSTEPGAPVSHQDLSHWRSAVARLLARLDVGPIPEREHLGLRITRLSHAGVVPREVAAFMRTITEMRNVTEYEAKQLTRAQSAVARAAWEALKEWGEPKGLEV